MTETMHEIETTHLTDLTEDDVADMTTGELREVLTDALRDLRAARDLVGDPRIVPELARLREQVRLLQEASTRDKMRSLPRQVRAFHKRFGHPVRHRPQAPSEAEARFRAALMLEEFSEVIGAMFELTPNMREAFQRLRSGVTGQHPFERAAVRVDLVELADGLGDLDYVVEGTRAVCGISGAPIADEIQRANMAKDPVYVRVKDAYHHGGAGGGDEWNEVPDPTAKPTKPADWTPPDIRRVLIDQGWDPRGDR